MQKSYMHMHALDPRAIQEENFICVVKKKKQVPMIPELISFLIYNTWEIVRRITVRPSSRRHLTY